MDKLRSMAVFVAVVDSGSFTAAAARYDISPVMVGKHIQFLERTLGARLLQRTTRRQRLTEIGAQYCEQCRLILAQVAAAESDAEAMRAAPRGRLRVTAPVDFGSQWLAGALADYMRAYPEVSVHLELSDRVIDLVEDGFDAAIRVGQLDDSQLVARPLWPYRMMIAAAPEYLARYGTPRTPSDLAAHECLDFDHWSKAVRWKLRAAPADLVIPASRLRCNSNIALKHAALAGFGITLQAALMLQAEVDAGLLTPILPDHVPEPRPMYLVYPRDRQPTPKLTTFIDFVLARFGAGTAPGTG
jgi:DNA-binding transcriptional LysR family regulator